MNGLLALAAHVHVCARLNTVSQYVITRELSVLMTRVQVRFFEVSEEELEKQRSAFSNGQLKIKIEHQEFSMR